MHWLYEKVGEKPDCIAIASYTEPAEAISKAKRLTQQWAEAGVTRHYKVQYRKYVEWEN